MTIWIFGNLLTIFKGIYPVCAPSRFVPAFVWCKDDVRLEALKLNGYSYGFSENADLVIDNFQQLGWKNYFDITLPVSTIEKLKSLL